MKNLPAIRVLAVLVCCIPLFNCGAGRSAQQSGSAEASLQTIVITPANATISDGMTVQLSAKGTYSNNSTEDLTNMVTWQADKSGVAQISNQGLVTGMKQGASQILASYGGVTGNTYVTVGAAVLVSITVTPTSSSLPVGESEQLAATGKFSDGSTQDVTQSVTWASQTKGIASIAATGSVVADAAGTTTITATSGSVAGQASLVVGQAALVSIAVSPNPSSVPLGESEQLSATGKFSDGSTQDVTKSATWASSSAGIANVNASGSVAAMSTGTASITANVGAVAGNASLTVGQAALVGIAVSPATSSLPLGETEQLSATGSFSDGSSQNLTQSVTWSSSSASASVSTSGTVLANSAGSATLTATAGSISGTGALTVTPPVVISVDVAPVTLSIVLGGSGQLHATAVWSNGATQDVTAASAWSATPAGIAAIGTTGMATSQQIGTTTVFATYGGATGTSNVTVIPLLYLSYYNRANALAAGVDGTMVLTNPGLTANLPTKGTLCAMIYVFDSSQEMSECCGCSVSDSGLRTLSLINDLTSNPVTGKSPSAGNIMVVASDIASNPSCDASQLTPSGALAGWETNNQSNGDGTYQLTEASFISGPLNSGSTANLPALCGFIETLGSGQGICTCGTGD